jgi:hypothetical protein
LSYSLKVGVKDTTIDENQFEQVLDQGDFINFGKLPSRTVGRIRDSHKIHYALKLKYKFDSMLVPLRTEHVLRGDNQARPTVIDSRSILAGVQGFESLSPHFLTSNI